MLGRVEGEERLEEPEPDGLTKLNLLPDQVLFKIVRDRMPSFTRQKLS